MKLTIRRFMIALAITAVGLSGVRSPDTALAFGSIELLLVGVPLVLLWKPSISFGPIICAISLWTMITLPIAILSVIYVQGYLHGYTLW